MIKSTRSRFFFKNLALFLIPMFVPLFLLGALSYVITQKYVKDEINKNNMNLLLQTKENIEMILNEMDSLNLNFSTNPEINFGLKRILRSDVNTLNKNDMDKLSIIKNFVDAPANSRPYIHSIYVYMNNNKDQFITTTSGIITLNGFYDTEWYTQVNFQNTNQKIWTEVRNIKRYNFEKKTTKLLTIYRKLYSPGMGQSDGVMVLNIYADYIEKLLGSLKVHPEQGIIITNADSEILFGISAANHLNPTILEQILKSSDSFFNTDSFGFGNTYTVSQVESKRYGWKYISFVPQDSIYNIPMKLSLFTSILLVFSFIFGLVITYYLTNRNFRNINNIISIIDSAENGLPLPHIPPRVNDEYGYIVQNILKTFIEHSFLKVQLSARRYKTKTMELLALQSQMNPHFLFNTLETLNWKVMGFTKKPNEANEMISNLSDILKYSLQDHESGVTVEEEIKNTKSYITIQKFRYRDKFDVIWECEEEILQCKIMKLLLQPLIENSIYHGIKTKEGKSCIKIKLHMSGSLLKVSVVDNGLGISPERLQEIKKKLVQEEEYSSHIGLFNTNKRLKLTYGDLYGLKIRSKANFGTVVFMYIPTNTTNS